jgi:hypothetical protein
VAETVPLPESRGRGSPVARADACGRYSRLGGVKWAFKLSPIRTINLLSRDDGKGYDLLQARF